MSNDVFDKKNSIIERMKDIEVREIDDVSDCTLTEYVLRHLKTEADYDKMIDFLNNNPNANTIDITVFCIDLGENRH